MVLWGMAKIITPLNQKQIDSLKYAGKQLRVACDSNGLYCLVNKNSKTWIMREAGGERKFIAIGDVSTMPLATARMEIAKAKTEAAKSPVKRGSLPSFEKASIEYIEAHASEWKNPKHLSQWINTLKTYAYPVIGNVAVDKITASDVIKVVDSVGARLETARRIRGRIAQVISATWTIHRTGQPFVNPAVNDVIKVLRPAIAKRLKRKHHVAIDVSKAPAAFQELLSKHKQNVSYAALCFNILTATRSNETANALFSEIKDDVWTIPDIKMKGGREHQIGLPKTAREIVAFRKLVAPDDALIFTSPKGEALSDAAMRQSLKRSCGDDLTVHGWRSTLKDWATELGYNDTVTEMILAHKVGNDTVRAYRRTDLLNMRTEILEKWNEYLLGGKK